jgi:hypothetical protein
MKSYEKFICGPIFVTEPFANGRRDEQTDTQPDDGDLRKYVTETGSAAMTYRFSETGSGIETFERVHGHTDRLKIAYAYFKQVG